MTAQIASDSAVDGSMRRRLGQAAVLVGVVSVLSLLALAGPMIRHVEASMAWFGLRFFTDTGVSGSTVYIHLDSAKAMGLTITGECSVSMLFVPPLVALAILTFMRNTNLARAVEATGLALLIIFMVNLLRIYAIAASYTWWGHDGFWLTHIVVGSIISIAAVLAGLVVQLRRSLRTAAVHTREF